MDITLVITRTGIFIAVYSLVLGIPFALAFGKQAQFKALLGENWWMAPLFSMAVFATAGPFLYLYIQRRAEERLFQEQLRYQSTLRQASLGMGRIKDLKRLVNLIVHIVTRTVRLEHSMVYIHDHSSGNYLIGASKSRKIRFKPLETINKDSVLVKQLLANRLPVVYDEIRQRTQDYGDLNLASLENELKELNAALVVPCFIGQKLQGVLVMGNKISGQSFSNNDLASLQILANQAALGMENSLYYDDLKKAHQQLFQAEKLAYVGTLAGSIVHEIRNPLTSIKSYIDYLPKKYHEPEFREKFERLIPREVQRIEGIVNQLLELVRRRPERSFPVNLGRVINTTLELLENSFQLKKITIRREFPESEVTVLADEEQLRQAFMNLFLNAIQAMEEGGQLSIKVSELSLVKGEEYLANPLEQSDSVPPPDLPHKGGGIPLASSPGGGKNTLMSPPPPWGGIEEGGKSRKSAQPFVRIAITDTGCGISEEMQKRLFTPFQTSKADGIGLGLSITKEIIENHKGTIEVESVVDQGTTFLITFPTMTDKK